MEIKVRQGESLSFNFNYDNEADSVTFTVWDDEGTVEIQENEPLVDGVAAFNIEAVDLPVATYNYGFEIAYSNGNTKQLPDSTDCDGDCEFPELVVCEGIPEES